MLILFHIFLFLLILICRYHRLPLKKKKQIYVENEGNIFLENLRVWQPPLQLKETMSEFVARQRETLSSQSDFFKCVCCTSSKQPFCCLSVLFVSGGDQPSDELCVQGAPVPPASGAAVPPHHPHHPCSFRILVFLSHSKCPFCQKGVWSKKDWCFSIWWTEMKKGQQRNYWSISWRRRLLRWCSFRHLAMILILGCWFFLFVFFGHVSISASSIS